MMSDNAGAADAVGPKRHSVILDAENVQVSDDASYTLTYGGDRPWFVKWQEAVRHYDDLTRAYDGTWEGQRDTSDFTRLVNDFCDSCFEVKNSLASDPAIPQA